MFVHTICAERSCFMCQPVVRVEGLCYNVHIKSTSVYYRVTKMDQEQYVLVKWSILPEAMQKTIEAKKLLETQQVKTILEAVQRVGLSRSAFYKYKDSIYPVSALAREEIVTLSMNLAHRSGVLSSVLSTAAVHGGNVLTIHQTIPLQGMANVVITLEMTRPEVGVSELLAEIRRLDGVQHVQLIGRG